MTENWSGGAGKTAKCEIEQSEVVVGFDFVAFAAAAAAAFALDYENEGEKEVDYDGTTELHVQIGNEKSQSRTYDKLEGREKTTESYFDDKSALSDRDCDCDYEFVAAGTGTVSLVAPDVAAESSSYSAPPHATRDRSVPSRHSSHFPHFHAEEAGSSLIRSFVGEGRGEEKTTMTRRTEKGEKRRTGQIEEEGEEEKKKMMKGE